MTLDKERLRVLASDCTSHPLSRGISDIEEAGEGISALLSENAALEKREQQALQAASVEAKLFDEERQKNAALAAEVERLRTDVRRVDAFIKFMRDNAFNPELHAHETRDLLETCKRLEEWRSGIND